ncbi:CpsD/CapB family tyrosine-protein kinase [Bacillus taeanensis]|uniref:non-specific protein-tyrosine kinase n=1 Tax=Bacillus taeanensis TaxID=273032 RepID=A0A366XXN0_9BACI|nr:CpsD/CapB family tyrosine-protein kinase [Bacillus taeanensis]RBW68894.1 capsular biosynthesis protein [Bacillus taeanensis]
MSRKKRGSIVTNKQRSLIAHYKPKSPFTEQYRTIRTNIQFASVDQDIRTLMVTSPGPGEGKSTTAANIAAVIAQQGKRVLLIDADMRKPTVHYTFQTSNTQGVTNVLTRQLTLNEAVLATEVENLSILSSGPVPPNPSELLGSKMMDQLIDEALKTFDMVIFDTPPILAVTDAQIVANRCQGSVLVVSSGKTENEAALKAKESLEHAKAKLLGVVLNRKEMKQGQYHYYYGNK